MLPVHGGPGGPIYRTTARDPLGVAPDGQHVSVEGKSATTPCFIETFERLVTTVMRA